MVDRRTTRSTPVRPRLGRSPGPTETWLYRWSELGPPVQSPSHPAAPDNIESHAGRPKIYLRQIDLLRLSPMTRRFVRFRRTYLQEQPTVDRFGDGQSVGKLLPFSMPDGHWTLSFFSLDCVFKFLSVIVTCRTARGLGPFEK